MIAHPVYDVCIIPASFSCKINVSLAVDVRNCIIFLKLI